MMSTYMEEDVEMMSTHMEEDVEMMSTYMEEDSLEMDHGYSKDDLSLYKLRTLPKIAKEIDRMHGLDENHYLDESSIFKAPFPCKVTQVLIKEGMKIHVGQPIFKVQVPLTCVPFKTYLEPDKTGYKLALENSSKVGIYSLEDVLVDHKATDGPPMQDLRFEAVMTRYDSFKRFDVVEDFSDHLFSSRCSETQTHDPKWANTIIGERRILEERLPETIFVRAYESRMELLRAVIIGPHGTPYQDGLFFFDVFFPDNYPIEPPLVRYHSFGLGINPNIHKCGEVCLRIFYPNGQLGNLWGPSMNMLRLLVCIQDLVLCTKPLFNGFGIASFRGSVAGEWLALLYNENTVLNTLKTMVYTMENPPKNFEALIHGHFRKRVFDILKPCKLYAEGQRFGCLISNNYDEYCSSKFETDVYLYFKTLVNSFLSIGADEAHDYYCFEVVNPGFNDTVEYLLNKRKVIEHENVPWHVLAYRGCTVTEVLVKKGVNVEKGATLYRGNEAVGHEALISLEEKQNTAIVKILVQNYSSCAGIFSMENVLDHQDGAKIRPVPWRLDEGLRKRYKNFKKFQSVMDCSDHFFSKESPATNQGREDWVKKIVDERRLLEENLPENIYVRVYDPRIDLLRAVIIGREGTPYSGGLFFFDVCFPNDYPTSPPLVHYHSCGFRINPDLYERGEVCLNGLPVTDCGSQVLQLLVFIQNQVLNADPLFNDITYAGMKGTSFGNVCSYLYNKTVLTKSLKTMVCVMNRPLMHFEDLVDGHFCSRIRYICKMGSRNKLGEKTKTLVVDALIKHFYGNPRSME